MSAAQAQPSPDTAAGVEVFQIGSTDIVTVEERKESPRMRYVVRFKDCTPTEESVNASIEVLKIFADITWDFELLCDMRQARLLSQLSHTSSYYRLVQLIRNDHCKHCFVYLSPMLPGVGAILTTTVSAIVSALGVECSLVQMEGGRG